MVKVKEEYLCTHNVYISCDEYNKCDNCGWNPKVQEKRKRLYREAEEGSKANEQTDSM